VINNEFLESFGFNRDLLLLVYFKFKFIDSIYFSRLLSIKNEFVVKASYSNFFFDFDLKVIPLVSAPGKLSSALLRYRLEIVNWPNEGFFLGYSVFYNMDCFFFLAYNAIFKAWSVNYLYSETDM